MSTLVFVSRRPGSHLTNTLDEIIEQNRTSGLKLCTWETPRREAVSPGIWLPEDDHTLSPQPPHPTSQFSPSLPYHHSRRT